MPAAVVAFQNSPLTSGFVKGTWTCDATPAATTIRCGFVPSSVMWWNETDKTVGGMWSPGMAAGTAMTLGAAAANISANGVTSVTGIPAAADAAGTVPGFTIGTDAGMQVASKVFGFIAFR